MKKKILSFLICLTLLISLCGCGKKVEEQGDVEQTKEPEKQLKIVNLKSKTRPYAVMINNNHAAWPQAGIQDAYIVYEMLVEGGFTRFLAVYKDKELDRIGTVRSSRHYFLDYALENDAIYVHFGWSPQAQSDIKSLNGLSNTINRGMPIIALPTTAGTAAEVTINYVITDEERKIKMVCVDPNDIPTLAIIDADLMATLPKSIAAATGMDALTHAVEGYITKAHNTMSDMFHMEAIKLIFKYLPAAVNEKNEEAIEMMGLAQYIAGMGFSNVGLGIVHSMAHQLGAVYDTPHGVACAMMLPIVMDFNKETTGEKYREIARVMGVKGVDSMTQDEYRAAAIQAVRQLSADVGIPAKLAAIKEEDLEFLAQSAAADACAPGNPKEASIDDFKAMFRQLM